MIFVVSNVTLWLFAFTLLSMPFGCSNPVNDSHNEEDHIYAVGVIISSGDREIVRYENGQIDGRVLVGVNQTTPLFSTLFIGEDGRTFVPEEDEGWTLSFEIGDMAVAEIEHNGKDAPWSFHVVGLKEGETFVVFKMNHFGHSDFVSKAVSIIVEE